MSEPKVDFHTINSVTIEGLKVQRDTISLTGDVIKQFAIDISTKADFDYMRRTEVPPEGEIQKHLANMIASELLKAKLIQFEIEEDKEWSRQTHIATLKVFDEQKYLEKFEPQRLM